MNLRLASTNVLNANIDGENTKPIYHLKLIISFSRKIIFQLTYLDGSIKEFLKFVSINLLNLFIPLLVWVVLDYINPELQKSEFWVLVVTVIIHGSILPIKYLIYKFFVFKDSL